MKSWFFTTIRKLVSLNEIDGLFSFRNITLHCSYKNYPFMKKLFSKEFSSEAVEYLGYEDSQQKSEEERINFLGVFKDNLGEYLKFDELD